MRGWHLQLCACATEHTQLSRPAGATSATTNAHLPLALALDQPGAHLALQLLDEGVAGVDLQAALAAHVLQLVGVAQGLRLGNLLHGGGPAVLQAVQYRAVQGGAGMLGRAADVVWKGERRHAACGRSSSPASQLPKPPRPVGGRQPSPSQPPRRTLEETTTQGVVARRLETLTPSTEEPSASFHHLARLLYSSCSRGEGGRLEGEKGAS